MANSFFEIVKFGFGAGLGMILINMLFISIGLAFFIPGLMMLSAERKKPPEEKNNTKLYTAYALMVLGCIFGLGLGAGFLFSELMMDF